MEKIILYKGNKYYAAARSDRNSILGSNEDIERAKDLLDSRGWDTIVELTVTRVFTRERDLKEIEIDNL